MNPRKERGSAITEFIVALFTIVPMFTLFTLVGKLSDAKHAAQEGARYQAWEMTVDASKSRDELKSEVHQRIFQSNSFIQSTDEDSDTEIHPNRHLWGMHGQQSGSEKEALFSFDEEGYSNTMVSRYAGTAVNTLGVTIDPVGELGIDEFENNDLYNAKIDFAINDVSWLRYEGGVACDSGTRESYLGCISSNNALLVDDWSAGSPDTVSKRVEALNPQLGLWETTAEVIDATITLPFEIITPGFEIYDPFEDVKEIEDAPGFVLPDLVPTPRLGSYEDQGIKKALD